MNVNGTTIVFMLLQLWNDPEQLDKHCSGALNRQTAIKMQQAFQTCFINKGLVVHPLILR